MASFNYNRVQLAGNLTRDPQVRFLSNERAVANFGLAVNRKFKGQDGQMQEETTFVDVEAWGRTAELIGQYLTKGRGCFIEGRLKLDSWEKDGQKQSKLKVVADNVQFLGDGRGRTQGDGGDAAPAAEGESAPAARPTKPAPAVAADDDGAPPF
jgi:single-strand DNA-binding protein